MNSNLTNPFQPNRCIVDFDIHLYATHKKIYILSVTLKIFVNISRWDVLRISNFVLPIYKDNKNSISVHFNPLLNLDLKKNTVHRFTNLIMVAKDD